MARYPSYCCPRCGELIGWIGRFLFPWFHKCQQDKKCETCGRGLRDDGTRTCCFDWPECSLAYDKWEPKRSRSEGYCAWLNGHGHHLEATDDSGKVFCEECGVELPPEGD